MESYLDVQHLTKSFGENVLFDDMSFSVSEGQKVGLVARNGTGKSTLLSILHTKQADCNCSLLVLCTITIFFSNSTCKYALYVVQ